jgi:outer membrane protein TolC
MVRTGAVERLSRRRQAAGPAPLVALALLLAATGARAETPPAPAPASKGAAAEPSPAALPPVPTLSVSTTAPGLPGLSGPSERLGLAEAVRRALDLNPTVAVARSEIERAEALVKEARSGYYPNLNLNAVYTRLDHDRRIGSTGQVVASGDQLTGNLTLTAPILAAPAWANTRHAEATRRIADASAADLRRQVAQATARAFLTVVAEHRLIEAVETARANAKEHYTYAHTRLVGGIGRAIDEVRAAQDLAAVERQVQTTYVGLAAAREALGILVASGTPVDAADEVDLGPAPSLADALAGARSDRTDVKLQGQRMVSAERVAKDVWVYYAPYLALVAQPFIQEPPTLLQPRFGWQAQLVFTLPIYDGGSRSGITRERDALLSEARINLDATLRQAASDVRLSFEAMLRADQALVSAREASRLAHRAYDLATIAYRAGASANIEVLDAARAARDADTAAAQAEDISRQARLDLLVASGRFP